MARKSGKYSLPAGKYVRERVVSTPVVRTGLVAPPSALGSQAEQYARSRREFPGVGASPEASRLQGHIDAAKAMGRQPRIGTGRVAQTASVDLQATKLNDLVKRGGPAPKERESMGIPPNARPEDVMSGKYSGGGDQPRGPDGRWI